MNKYDGLLTEIAKYLYILQGNKENEIEYKCRIIYSAVGRLAYASLQDLPEVNDAADIDISVTHFKRRIGKSFEYYLKIYPETEALINNTIETISEFSEEIYELFLKTGQFYHSPHRLSPAAFRSAVVDNILFTRGSALSDKNLVSGLGTYQQNLDGKTNINDVVQMFGLPEEKFYSFWNSVLKSTIWRSSELSVDVEYLNHDRTFVKDYWIERTVLDEAVSIMRTKESYNRLYFLYKFVNNELLVSQLPDWRTREGEVYLLINGCLYSYGKLPASSFSIDGNIVNLRIGYLYPPAEMNFINLYSWPKHFVGAYKSFDRVFNTEVFFSIKKILESIGYNFVEE